MMNGLLEAALLGALEGVTEFLPVSSTGHLLVASRLLGFGRSAGGTFEVFVQFGAVLALLAYYGRMLLAQARAIPTDGAARRFWAAVALAFLPAALAGFLLRDVIKRFLFTSPPLIAVSLILGGIVLLLADRRGSRPDAPEMVGAPRVQRVTGDRAVRVPLPAHVSRRQALVIGAAQAVALVPGVSRSGAAIVGGLVAGLDRPAATAFAFYLAIPTLGAATVYDLVKSASGLSGGDVLALLVGTVAAALVAWGSIGWLMRYVAGHSLAAFGAYRIVAGALLLAVWYAGLL